MAYVDYAYYISGYLLGKYPAVPEAVFPFWEKQAEKELDRFTFNRMKINPGLISEDVKDCVCAIIELLHKADKISEDAVSEGVAGVLTGYSNDGESASYDVSQSIYTESGKAKEIKRLIILYLGNSGMLYQGA